MEDLEVGEDSLRYCAIYMYTVLYSVYCAFFLDELTNLNILKKPNTCLYL